MGPDSINPHHLNPGPDPAFHFHADPDTDSDPHQSDGKSATNGL
jgi:hypothetical protein